jgi:hypothetical protein
MRPALTSAKTGSPPAYAHPAEAGESTLAAAISPRQSGASFAPHDGTGWPATIEARTAPARISAKRAHDA